jgi:tight adherence protein B
MNRAPHDPLRGRPRRGVVTRTVALAFAAGAAAVLGLWEALAAVERSRLAAGLERVLEPLQRAGREGRAPTPAERRRLALLATGALAAGGWLLGGVPLALLAAFLGPALTLAAVRARRRRYARAVRRGAAGAARALADAVGGGHSIRGAITAAASGIPGAAGHELRAAARALALGEPTADALEGLRRRAADPAWDAIVAGILLQRDAGGDLAALLRDQAAALEAADRIGRDARAATAQARFTARLVLVLPAGAAALAELASPGLVTGLLAHPLSVWLVAMAAVLQLTAILAVARLARVR